VSLGSLKRDIERKQMPLNRTAGLLPAFIVPVILNYLLLKSLVRACIFGFAKVGRVQTASLILIGFESFVKTKANG
jgi:hypothetical protein